MFGGGGCNHVRSANLHLKYFKKENITLSQRSVVSRLAGFFPLPPKRGVKISLYVWEDDLGSQSSLSLYVISLHIVPKGRRRT